VKKSGNYLTNPMIPKIEVRIIAMTKRIIIMKTMVLLIFNIPHRIIAIIKKEISPIVNSDRFNFIDFVNHPTIEETKLFGFK